LNKLILTPSSFISKFAPNFNRFQTKSALPNRTA
jgi:hypothetical protein